MKVPATELKDRLNRFRARMDQKQPGWELVAITGKVALYYFTGTMQDGLLLIPQDGDAVFWVRQSYERAADESDFPDIRPMWSYRDVAAGMARPLKTVNLETDLVTISQFRRMQKHLPFTRIEPVGDQILAVRAKKSPYELELMEHAGKIHRYALEDCVPRMLAEGIDEAIFGCNLYALMVREGHQGTIRFRQFNEMVLGQIGFGTSSICPTCADTAGGMSGLHPSAPHMVNRERRLRKGDLVVVDNGCGYQGYQTDKTLSYMFGTPIPENAIEEHFRCVEVQDTLASMLKPGAVPSRIYQTVMAGLEPQFRETIMAFGGQRVRFLGHGVGLWIDEAPVIAEGFDEPLQEGMVLALEPKKGIAGVGLVGTENTYVVTPQGGRSITGTSRGLIEVF